jgi:hypothetical protein
VRNDGDTDVLSARVDFWWSNPATGVTRTLATFVGSAYVDVAAGASSDVLCLVTWTPVIVNDGHECLVAEVISPADPLPTPPSDAFDLSFRQIAQRNLTVLAAGSMVLPIQLALAARAEAAKVSLVVEIGGDLDREALATLGMSDALPAAEPVVHAGLSRQRTCGAETRAELSVDISGGEARAVYLHVEPRAAVAKGEYTVVRVRSAGLSPDGGATYVVTEAPNHG